MAVYEYRNSAGETREIVASMKNPPPERLFFKAGTNDQKHHLRWTGWYDAGALDRPDVFTRVYSLPEIGRIDPGGEVKHAHQQGKPPTSVQLPRAAGGMIVNRNGHQVQEIKPGLYADMQGRRIVDSKESGDRHAADCGYVRTRED